MATALDDIVRVTIDLNQPPKDTKNFGTAMIFGPPPAPRRKPDGTLVEPDIYPVGLYKDADGVKAAGFRTTGEDADPIGIAARIGFSQLPSPAEMVVAVQQRSEYDAALYDCEVINDVGALIGETEADELGLEPGAEFLAVKYPHSSELCSITKNGQSYGGEVTVSGEAGDVDYCLIALANEGAGTFDVALPEGVSAQSRSIRLTYVVRWDADAQNASIQMLNESDLEPIEDTLDRAWEAGGWYGLCPAGISPDDFQKVMEWTEAHEAIASFPIYAFEGVETIYYRSFGICPKITDKQPVEEVPADNNYAHVADMGRFLGYQPGKYAWFHKSLVGIRPSKLSSTYKALLDKINVSYYITVAGLDDVLGGKVLAGEWIDVIHFRDWLKNDMQLRIFTLLRVNPKLPYTDEGIRLVKAQMEASLMQGQEYGGIAPDEFDEDGNLQKAFKATVPLAAKLTAVQKSSRVLKDCTFWARLAGAIFAIELYGALLYEPPALAA